VYLIFEIGPSACQEALGFLTLEGSGQYLQLGIAPNSVNLFVSHLNN